MKLLTTSNAKISKTNSVQDKYITAILHLAPHKLSGYNVCSEASEACIEECLNTAGMGVYSTVQAARIRKTKLLFEDRLTFYNYLSSDMEYLERKSLKERKKVAIRLNGLSDVAWEEIFPDIFTRFRKFTFYNYTKVYKRMLKYLDGRLPSNSYYVFSRSEKNEEKCKEILKLGGKVAVVFRNIPKEYLGYRVTSGDNHDLIFKNKGPILGLIAKGKAKKDKKGFVV